MRVPAILVVLVLAVGLAGCTDPGDVTPSKDQAKAPEAGPDDDGDAGGTAPPAAQGEATETRVAEVLSGTLTWHSQETKGVTMPVTLAAQPALNECVSSSDGSVGVTNLDLTAAGTPDVPDATNALEVLFEWEDSGTPRTASSLPISRSTEA